MMRGRRLRNRALGLLCCLTLTTTIARSLYARNLTLLDCQFLLSPPEIPALSPLALDVPMRRLDGVVDAVVVVLRNEEGQIFFGKRGGPIGRGQWGLVGGKMDDGESILATATRETHEEIGVALQDVQYVMTNVHRLATEPGKTFRSFIVMARIATGVPKIMEPSKCLELGWFDPEYLPQPMFLGAHAHMDRVLRRIRDVEKHSMLY